MEISTSIGENIENWTKVSTKTPLELDQATASVPRLPSLHKMDILMPREPEPWFAPPPRIPSNQDFVERLLTRSDETSGDLKCRLVIAQLLKDIDFPRERFPPYVQTAMNDVLHQAIKNASDDTVDLLLSLEVRVNCSSRPSLLEEVCYGKLSKEYWEKQRNGEDATGIDGHEWREYVARRLIDEGCHWFSLKKNRAGDTNSDAQAARTLARKQMFEYARQKEQVKVEEILMSLSFKIKQRTNERDVGGVGKYRGFQLGGVCSLLIVKEQRHVGHVASAALLTYLPRTKPK
jgi:hypothetical protein